MRLRRDGGSPAPLIIGGFALSRLVDSIVSVAAAVVVVNQLHSAGWVAAVTSARLVPMAVLGVLVVAAVQAVDQRLVLLAGTLLRTVAAGALGLLDQRSTFHPALFVIAVAAAGLGSSPYRAGAGRLLATHTPENRLIAASTAFSRVDYASLLVAPGLAGAVLIASDTRTALALAAGLAMGLLILLGGSWSRLSPPAEGRRPGAGRAMRQVRSAARLVLAVQEVRSYLALRAVARASLGVVGVAIALIPARDHEPTSHIAFLQTALGVGAVVVALIPSRRPDRGGVPILVIAAVTLAAAVIALGASRNLALACGLLAVIGAADLIVHLAASGSLHRALPRTASAAGSGVADSLVALGTLGGTLAAPSLIHTFGLPATCSIAAAALLVAAGVLLPGLRRADALLESRRRGAAPVYDVLAGSDALHGVSEPNLELLAEAAELIPVRRGALAIAEGDDPDGVFVVQDGRFAVHVAGEDARRTGRLDTLGPGALFGEIGVLHRRRRTASVLAVETGIVIKLPADIFVLAATADLGTSTGMYLDMERRLQRSHD